MNKGVVASYQAAISEEYTPMEGVKPVLTWSKRCPGHNKMVFKDQIQWRCHRVSFLEYEKAGLFCNIIGGSIGKNYP